MDQPVWAVVAENPAPTPTASSLGRVPAHVHSRAIGERNEMDGC